MALVNGYVMGGQIKCDGCWLGTQPRALRAEEEFRFPLKYCMVAVIQLRPTYGCSGPDLKYNSMSYRLKAIIESAHETQSRFQGSVFVPINSWRDQVMIYVNTSLITQFL